MLFVADHFLGLFQGLVMLLRVMFGKDLLCFCLVLVEPVGCFQEQKVSERGKSRDLLFCHTSTFDDFVS